MGFIGKVSSRAVGVLDFLGGRLTLAFFIIFGISVIIRTGLLLALPKGQIELQSEAERIGASLAEHGTFADPYLLPTGPTSHTAPFYPFLVSGIYRVFGTGYTGGLVRCELLICVYSLLYGFYPLLTRSLGFPVQSGVLGGLLSAILPLKRSAEVWRGWDESYAAIATAILLVVTLHVWESRKLDLKTAAIYGLGWGVTFHMAPALAPVVAALCLVHVIRFTAGQRLRAMQWWGVALASVLIVVLPWTLRNYNQFGKWMFMRGNLGLELYVSNADQAEPSHEMNQVMLKQVHPSHSEDAARKVGAMGEIAYNRDLQHRAVEWIIDNPGRFLHLTATRALYFWTGPWEHPEILVLSGLLTVFAFAGLVNIARDGAAEKTALFTTVWIVYPLVYYVVQYFNRYRVPIDWTITVPAAVFLYRRLKAGARSSSVAQGFPAPALASR